jgi:hypothetical protein
MSQSLHPHGFTKQPSADMRNRKPAHYHGQSGRLKFRPFAGVDAPRFAELSSNPNVQKTDLCFDGEITLERAQEIIQCYQHAWDDQSALFFAIRLKNNDRLIGSISLMMTPAYDRAELGFWIGEAYWSQGYGSEAARAILGFGFHELNLHRIHAQHLGHNPASGKIMQKCGMKYEGCLRQHVCQGTDWFDMHQYGVMRNEYDIYSELQLRQLALSI